MRSTFRLVVIASTLSFACLAQQWEFGGTGGYGWYSNPSIGNPNVSIGAGPASKGVIGVVFGENQYEYFSGEFRYLFQFGGPQLSSHGVQVNTPGFTNALTYDLLVHMTNREARFRPYASAGAGIKIFTGHELRFTDQPFPAYALLLPATQVEPAISAGGGVKYRLSRRALLRLDFRTYMTPLPNRIFRTTLASRSSGWVFNFVPLAGVSVLF